MIQLDCVSSARTHSKTTLRLHNAQTHAHIYIYWYACLLDSLVSFALCGWGRLAGLTLLGCTAFLRCGFLLCIGRWWKQLLPYTFFWSSSPILLCSCSCWFFWLRFLSLCFFGWLSLFLNCFLNFWFLNLFLNLCRGGFRANVLTVPWLE